MHSVTCKHSLPLQVVKNRIRRHCKSQLLIRKQPLAILAEQFTRPSSRQINVNVNDATLDSINRDDHLDIVISVRNFVNLRNKRNGPVVSRVGGLDVSSI